MAVPTALVVAALLSMFESSENDGRWIGNISSPFAEARMAADSITMSAVALVDEAPAPKAGREAALAEAMRRLHQSLRLLAPFEPAPAAQTAQRGNLIAPIANRPLNAGFGLRPRFTSPTEARHTGLSFAVAGGEPVVACARGVVTESIIVPGLGNTVIVDHGNQLMSVYAGLSNVAVSAGQPVAAGDQLGTAGERSLYGQRELYFELRKEGLPIDPIRWIQGGRLTAPRLVPPWRQPPPDRASKQ